MQIAIALFDRFTALDAVGPSRSCITGPIAKSFPLPNGCGMSVMSPAP